MAHRALPPSLNAGLAISVVAHVVNLAGGLADEAYLAGARWQLFWSGVLFAEYLLIASGLFELARQTTGTAHRMLRVSAWLYVTLLLWNTSSPFVYVLSREAWIFEMLRWSYFASGLCALGVAVALSVAARAFVRAPAAALLVIVAVLARGWLPYITDGLHELLWQYRTLNLVYWCVNGLMWAAGMAWLARRIVDGTSERAADPSVSAGGLRLAAAALRFRIVLSIGLAVLAMGLIRSTSGIEVLLIGGPLVTSGTMVVCAVGLLRAGRGGVDGLPRLRIACGAGLTSWWAAVHLHQNLWAYRGVSGIGSDAGQFAVTWTIAGPLIAMTGLALVGSAVSAFAAARADDKLREAAAVRTLLLVVLSISSIAIQSQLLGSGGRHHHVLLVVVAAGAAVGALIAFTGLLARAADVIATAPTIPAARVHGST